MFFLLFEDTVYFLFHLPELLNVVIFIFLQSMYEERKTKLKWFRLSRYYFPGDLPENVGRPCTTDCNEVEYFIVYFFSAFLQCLHTMCN